MIRLTIDALFGQIADERAALVARAKHQTKIGTTVQRSCAEVKDTPCLCRRNHAIKYATGNRAKTIRIVTNDDDKASSMAIGTSQRKVRAIGAFLNCST